MMETLVTIAICVLASIFVGSFVGLLLLCRHRNLRKRTARYVKKFARSDFRRSETELVCKETNGEDTSFGTSLAQLLKETSGSSGSYTNMDLDGGGSSCVKTSVTLRCMAVLNLSKGIDLNSRPTPEQLETLHRIIRVAKSITEESEEMTTADNREKAGLLEAQTTSLVNQVSRTLASMERQLLAVRENNFPSSRVEPYLRSYQSTTLM